MESCTTRVALDVDDHDAVARFCENKGINLAVIGPEAPLVAGLGDRLRAEGVSVFGPSAAAAQLEGSKGFTKDLCRRADIPTAAYARAETAEEALAALDDFAVPVVIKADGLAAGKGVIIAESEDEARAAIDDIFGGRFGDAGASVVIEEFMEGEEASFFALTDGRTIIPFGSAQDHKRVGEGDTGPNTGGMGAYSPATVLTPVLEGEVIERIIAPTVRAMSEDGTPYQGVLYAGLMLTDEGPKLIEYNCRFGDPECQVLMMRYTGDLAELLMAAAEHALGSIEPPRFSAQTAMTVVMAANGYPGTPAKGGRIAGIDAAQSDDLTVFHAGTARDGDGNLVANGGRVLNVTATGSDIAEARERAYAGVDAIEFPTGFTRRDIGWRELEREEAP